MSPDNAFTVFIVDDDADVARALSRLLKSRGYETQSFTSSREFLERHDAAQPGCAVLDLSMPDLNGLELQRALTREGALLRPIIFLSGHGDIPTSVQAVKAGAVDFRETESLSIKRLVNFTRGVTLASARLQDRKTCVLLLL